MSLSFLFNFIWGQLTVTPPKPTEDFTGQTIIVTGSNTGLGLEAARHFTRLNASRVILAVRSTSKGESAAESITTSTKRDGVVEVWTLDLSSYDSVKAFADRVIGLPRLDAVVENAGIARDQWVWSSNVVNGKDLGGESTIVTNVISTFLLAWLVLPKLQETARKFNRTTRLGIVTSEVHFFTQLPEKEQKSILDAVNDEKTARMFDRYNVSKLLEVLYIRRFAAALPVNEKGVAITMLNPGLCHSELAREASWGLAVMKFFLARTTEVGSRTLVDSVTDGQGKKEGPEQRHGQYLSDCHVAPVSALVTGPEGPELEKRVWGEVNEVLEKIVPGVTSKA